MLISKSPLQGMTMPNKKAYKVTLSAILSICFTSLFLFLSACAPVPCPDQHYGLVKCTPHSRDPKCRVALWQAAYRPLDRQWFWADSTRDWTRTCCFCPQWDYPYEAVKINKYMPPACPGKPPAKVYRKYYK